ncbi:NAP1-related protein 2 [Hibiscus syriacus]|uniref:NAP1-related protein 2 n=1 Tax=Hibiscus syriacus TaxID=106335 RepID=A0A6A2XNA7_HIBSY|nr:NAP1-related protein 2 [Hibiscus syriacus]
MNSTISVSSTAPPSLPPPCPHNDPTLLFYNINESTLFFLFALCCRKLRFQKNPCLNLNSLLKRGYFRISCLIAEEASEKVLEVEQKYNEIRKPIYDKRNEKIKSILDLWLTAFLSHPALGELLNDEDQKIFKYISSLEVEDFKDLKSGYSITFNFDPNPYFEDANLTKTFTFLDEGTKITATKIKWKEGMGLPNGVDHEKKGNKRQFAEESFFTWFSDTQQKDDMDEIHDEDADEEDFEDDEEVDKQGLPIGLQLIGRPWGEATVLRLASAI